MPRVAWERRWDEPATTVAPPNGHQGRVDGDVEVSVVGPVGIEPTTRGLKVRCSAN